MTNVSNNSNEQRVQQQTSKFIQKVSKSPSRAVFNKCLTTYHNSVQRQLVFSSVTPAECPEDSVTPPSSHHNTPGYTV